MATNKRWCKVIANQLADIENRDKGSGVKLIFELGEAKLETQLKRWIDAMIEQEGANIPLGNSVIMKAAPEGMTLEVYQEVVRVFLEIYVERVKRLEAEQKLQQLRYESLQMQLETDKKRLQTLAGRQQEILMEIQSLEKQLTVIDPEHPYMKFVTQKDG